jgi:hypothetical protein
MAFPVPQDILAFRVLLDLQDLLDLREQQVFKDLWEDQEHQEQLE